MKVILIATLFLFSLCENEIDGGWERSSIYIDDFDAQKTFEAAYSEYLKEIDGEKTDKLLPLTVYKQIVSGTNYKVCFLDQNADFPTIQEYEYYHPLAVNTGGKDEYRLTEHTEYEPTNGLINFNDNNFSKVEYQLYKKLKNISKKLCFISYAYLIENGETNFYFVNAETDNGESNFILVQDKENKEFYLCEEVKK